MNMDKFYKSMTSVKELWSQEHEKPKMNVMETNLTSLATPQILEIGNILNAIVDNLGWDDSENTIQYLKKIKLETPRMVVVGTQSSGKSSVLNGILALDMLPIGKNMVTRTPLRMELNQTDGLMSVEFGNYEKGEWSIEKKISLTSPEPRESEIEQVRDEIEMQTIKRAGSGMNISQKEIIIKYYSPNVPNLSLIDLPGLTNIACTDKGQPKDIKEQIRNLVSKYIKSEKSLILAVMASRTDLEADMGLDLVKQHDPNGHRTIGILTKTDLMNTETDISDYLYNNVSVDLQLKYGYYAVRNRSSNEMMVLTYKQGLQKEMDFFNGHSIYSKMDDDTKRRLGIRNVSNSLSKILIDHIRESLPDLLYNLKELQMGMEKVVNGMGNCIPDDIELRKNYLQDVLNRFATQYISSLEDRGATFNVGRRIKSIFEKYRENVDALNPFQDEKVYDRKYFQNVIQNGEGNHMSLFYLPIEVIEACLKDKEKQPLMELYYPSQMCLDGVQQELMNLTEKQIQCQYLERFPQLCSKIRDIVNLDIIAKSCEETKLQLKYLIDEEMEYIWTDDKEFKQTLQELMSSTDKDQSQLLKLISGKYFDVIKKILEHSVPKRIMLFLVRKVEKTIHSTLFHNGNNLLKLLVEKPEEEEKRQKYKKCLRALQMANQIFEKIK